jgi:hypothetical protein
MAIIRPGSVLSHPATPTSARSPLARAVCSTESAIRSRLASELRMPSLPIAIPSVTVMVVNSCGAPPAAETPCITARAWRRRAMLHGAASFQVDTTPTGMPSPPSSCAVRSIAALMSPSIPPAGAR